MADPQTFQGRKKMYPKKKGVKKKGEFYIQGREGQQPQKQEMITCHKFGGFLLYFQLKFTPQIY